MFGGFTHPFINFAGCTIQVWKWGISLHVTHYNECYYLSIPESKLYSMLVKSFIFCDENGNDIFNISKRVNNCVICYIAPHLSSECVSDGYPILQGRVHYLCTFYSHAVNGVTSYLQDLRVLEVKTITYENDYAYDGWSRIYEALPDGYHQVLIEGKRPPGNNENGIAIDDIYITSCQTFSR